MWKSSELLEKSAVWSTGLRMPEKRMVSELAAVMTEILLKKALSFNQSIHHQDLPVVDG